MRKCILALWLKNYLRTAGSPAPGSTSTANATAGGSFYFRSGQVKAEAGYRGGQLDGDCVWYREGGGLLQKGAFRDGQQDGFWQRWHRSGELLDEGSFDVGRKTGEWITYSPDGTETKRKTFK
ncbi:toxin-antitoxin system YwqK family antitoxin [Arthrobacter sp. H16F315]|uniref:toxin-antitoxin system YwqK family antitoxin n=1 Tax=Arthrobacter sp. H16F315 TaxID=2955314 RepID=UPI00209768D4|nr:hypothetical protein [Arthrobacter sp. H16F315]MDD1476164.1 hypothetical protein [Arthrobacter sp. H16F315]